MRRLIILTLALCMLGFSASAWAGPGNNGRNNHGQAVRQFNQQNRHGNQSFHRQGDQHFRRSAPGLSGRRFAQPGHYRHHQRWSHAPRRHQGHRFQGHRPREVRRHMHTGRRNMTTSSVQSSFLSLGGGQMLSFQVLATD